MPRLLLSAVSMSVLLVAIGCGGSREPPPPGGKSGGKQAEERMLKGLGGAAGASKTVVKLCDGTPVRVINVPGKDAVDSWREERDDARRTGLWPVIVGAPDDVALLSDVVGYNCKHSGTYERRLRQASRVDIEKVLDRIARAYGVRAV